MTKIYACLIGNWVCLNDDPGSIYICILNDILFIVNKKSVLIYIIKTLCERQIYLIKSIKKSTWTFTFRCSCFYP